MSNVEQRLLERWREYITRIDASDRASDFEKGMACGLQEALIALWGHQ